MRRSRFSEEQIIGVLREQEAGIKPSDLCRKHGISETTLYKWKAKFGGMTVPETARLRTLEEENRRLKKLLAEQMLDNAVLKDLLGKNLITPAARFDAVRRVIAAHGLSERRVCRLLGVDRSSFQYERSGGDDAAVRARLRELANERRRFGYRRLAILLRREGRAINLKRVYRLYKEERLMVRKRGGRKRALGTRAPATQGNQTWAMDFVHDQLATGRKIRILTVVDTFTRFSPAIDPRFSYRGEDVVQTLERICRSVGYPRTIRVDQGSEFVSHDLDLWAYQKNVVLDFSRPGKPTDNGFIESFNGKLRAECLNTHWFMSLDDARVKMEEWRKDYNDVRPHSALGNKPPRAFMNGLPAPPPAAA